MRRGSVEALDALFELASRLGDLMHTDLAARELTPARAEVLLVLRDSDRPLVQRELADQLRCTPRHITGLVDTLEAGGWVHRTPHPTDRRATIVELTTTGVAAAKRMQRERRQAAGALFRDLPARDVDGFLAVARHVLDRLNHQ